MSFHLRIIFSNDLQIYSSHLQVSKIFYNNAAEGGKININRQRMFYQAKAGYINKNKCILASLKAESSVQLWEVVTM